MAKLRADSKLAALSETARYELVSLWAKGSTHEDVAHWLRDTHGIDMSEQALSNYYRRHVTKNNWLNEIATAEQLSAMDDEAVIEASHKAVAQKVFFMATSEPGAFNPELLEKFYKLMIQAENIRHTDRRIKLLEEQAARAVKAKEALTKTVTGGGISAETRKEIEQAMQLL